MKNIKLVSLLTVCLTATASVKAQDLKTEVAKPAAVKAPAASTVTNAPSPAPEFKPQDGVQPKVAPTSETAEVPSPKKKEEARPAIQPKLILVKVDDNKITPSANDKAGPPKPTIDRSNPLASSPIEPGQ